MNEQADIISITKKMANKDIVRYVNFVNDKVKDQEGVKFDICCNINEYSLYDCLQVKHTPTGTDLAYLELKGRYYPMSQFPDCAVDKLKIQRLNQLTLHSGIKSYIVAIYYENNKILIWELDPEGEYEEKEMAVTQTQSMSNAPKVKRTMVLLPLSKARKFTYIPN